jgi:hypothetical protein
VPLWNILTSVHIKTTASVLKCSNALSLFIEEVGREEVFEEVFFNRCIFKNIDAPEIS